MSGVVDVLCGGCPVWWMSSIVDVLFYPWCGICLVCWMSSLPIGWWMTLDTGHWTLDVWCGGCRTIKILVISKCKFFSFFLLLRLNRLLFCDIWERKEKNVSFTKTYICQTSIYLKRFVQVCIYFKSVS